MAKDPVCGMSVNEATAKWTSEHQGRKFHFCSAGCKASFDRNPAKYAR